MLLKIFLAKQVILLQNMTQYMFCYWYVWNSYDVLVKEIPCSRMRQNHKKVRLQMWFDVENGSFNAECINNNILAKGMLISVQN
jgi:hypothetical protein